MTESTLLGKNHVFCTITVKSLNPYFANFFCIYIHNKNFIYFQDRSCEFGNYQQIDSMVNVLLCFVISKFIAKNWKQCASYRPMVQLSWSKIVRYFWHILLSYLFPLCCTLQIFVILVLPGFCSYGVILIWKHFTVYDRLQKRPIFTMLCLSM